MLKIWVQNDQNQVRNITNIFKNENDQPKNEPNYTQWAS